MRIYPHSSAKTLYFEPAIFGHYDMFFAVSRVPFASNTPTHIDAALLNAPRGRIALGLLDVRERELNLTRKLEESESDRAARGEQIESLSALLKESESDRTARWTQIETLTRMLRESGADRVALGEQIETLVADLRALFARPGFRWLVRFSSWPEVKKLAKRIGAHNE